MRVGKKRKYVELTTFPSCEATWVVGEVGGEEKMLRNLAALSVVSFIVRRISKSCGRGKFQLFIPSSMISDKK